MGESGRLKELIPSECMGQVNGWKGRAMLEGQLDRKGGAVASITGALGAGRGQTWSTGSGARGPTGGLKHMGCIGLPFNMGATQR